jgi:hypothetical protein
MDADRTGAGHVIELHFRLPLNVCATVTANASIRPKRGK